MRRAMIGTVAGWLASVTTVLAQQPYPAYRTPAERPLPVMESPDPNERPSRGDRYYPGERLPALDRPAPADRLPPLERQPYYDRDLPPERMMPVERRTIDDRYGMPGDRRVVDERYGPPSERRVVDERYGPPMDRFGPPTDRSGMATPYAIYGRHDQNPGYIDGPMAPPRRGGNEALPAPGMMMDTNARLGRHGNWNGGNDGCNNGCDNGCNNNCNRCPCGACGPDGRLWASAEYILAWNSGMGVPPLVTSSPAGTPLNAVNGAGVRVPVAGALGQATTTVIYGGTPLGTTVRSGFRARAGFWLDECNMLGFDGGFMFLGIRSESYISPFCDANDIHMRPFFNASTNLQDAEIVCFPGILNGRVTVDSFNEFYTAEANVRRNLCCGECMRIDALAGYRFASLSDRLLIAENLVDVNPNNVVPDGTTIIVRDQFSSENIFHGGQLGLAGEWRNGRWFFDWRGTVALGATSHSVTIFGDTTTTTPGGVPVRNIGGLLAQGTNIGNYRWTDFSVLPELGINVGIQAMDNLRLYVGYSFLYWSNVARAGNQIDFAVNSTQIPPGILVGPARPTMPFARTDWWVQGVSFGAQLRY